MDNPNNDEFEDLDDITDEEENGEEAMTQEDSEAVYQNMVTVLPEREVFLDADDVEMHKSATEVEEDSIQQSDTKVILKALTPKSKYPRVNDICQPAMVSRIFPDNLLDKQKLIVLALLQEYGESAVPPFIDLMMNVQDFLSIGYNGMGIVERLEMAGVAREEELEKQVRDLMS